MAARPRPRAEPTKPAREPSRKYSARAGSGAWSNRNFSANIIYFGQSQILSPPSEFDDDIIDQSSKNASEKKELDTYLTTDFGNEDTSDIIKFWINNKKRFPLLAPCALRILSIPPSTVECERSFSGLKNFVTDKRTNLSREQINLSFISKSMDSISNNLSL